MTKIFERRFSELESQVISIEATKQRRHSEYSASYDHIDDNLILNWQVKVKNLLSNLCGEDSQHFTAFVKAGKASSFTSNYTILQQMKAVFMAAKEDFEGGYLNSVRNLVQAEVFDNELDQAKELLGSGYAAAAAVIAGTVLETTLRNMCSDNGLPLGKLDKMNADLTKQGVYNNLIQKRITALAGVRNSAAHGKTEEFNKDDVHSMINEIERFVASTLS